jgi:hypothetical protein
MGRLDLVANIRQKQLKIRENQPHMLEILKGSAPAEVSISMNRATKDYLRAQQVHL